MGRRRMRWAAALAAGALLAACGDVAPATPTRLVIGVVPAESVDRLVADAGRLAELLSAELDIPVEPRVTDNYPALVVAMQSGQTDVGLLGPVTLVEAMDDAGVVPILQSVRAGGPTYHRQWMTNDPATYCTTPVVEVPNAEGEAFTYCNGTDTARTGPVGEQGLRTLVEGAPVMFVDAASAPGYHYPVTQIQQVTGIDPRTGIDAQFVGSDPEAVLAVARGDVPVGVSSADARDDVVEEDPEIGVQVTVFAWSPEIPHDGVAARGDLPEEFRTRVAEAMTAVIATPAGAAAFEAVYGIEGLVPADPRTLDAARQVAANFGG